MIHNSLLNKLHRYFFYLLLVLLPTQLGYHWWPSWALVLGRRIDYLSPTLYVTDILIFFVILFWVIDWISRSMNHELGIMVKTKTRSFLIHYSLFILLLCLFTGINILFASNHMVALFAWIKIAELVGLGLYIIHTKPKFSSILFPLSIGVLYSSMIALAQFIFQHSIGGIFWFLGERTFTSQTPGIAQIPFCFPSRLNCPLLLRAYGTFSHPNVLGGFLAITLPLLLTQFLKKKNLFYIVTCVVGILALVLTFSRSAWIVALFGMAYVIVREKKKFIVFTLLSAGIVLFYIGNTFRFQDESIVVRQQLNAAAVSMFFGSPVIGNGLGNFLVGLPAHLVSRQIYFLQPVHNIYLLLLSEIGIIGFGIFIYLIISCFKNYESGIMNNRKNLFLSSIIIHYSLFAILLLGLIDHYFLTLQQGQVLFTIFLSLSLLQ